MPVMVVFWIFGWCLSSIGLIDERRKTLRGQL
jgi:hypothetical protein